MIHLKQCRFNYLSHKQYCNYFICLNMDETGDHHAKQNKLIIYSKCYIFSFICEIYSEI